jgi:5-(carboxyamino)imidazole ribonucleotide synthase
MINLLGEQGHFGKTHYQGLFEVLQMSGVHLHLYGKSFTSPYRKMGHATIVADSIEKAIKKAKQVQAMLKVVSQ